MRRQADRCSSPAMLGPGSTLGKTGWQMFHKPRDCFNLILVQVEAKRLSLERLEYPSDLALLCIYSVGEAVHALVKSAVR